MYNSKKEISTLANKVLIQAKINRPPISPEKIALNLGLEIVNRNLSDDVSGALVLKEDSQPIIVVNSSHSPVRKRFTIAHELGHFLLKHGRDGLFIDRSEHFIFRNEVSATGEKRQEVEANAFAAALLMPEKMVRTEMEELSNIGIEIHDEAGLELIKTLAKKFNVSSTSMTFRIANLSLMDNF